ncbi:hypothetical protein [Agrococcus jejuensis]|uniref:Uncharacterized protein n=1 Tax=Agrococcus jejuensis TaxID=399736 RepID=A0A1G8H467_9MICO|nr:hypothetical protein [Agrococcus jejuensis]SDI01361.1 hypothetical protein SAMN04489720_3204 [Agrococcus jejuensis]
MLDPSAPPAIAILVVVTAVLAVALPIIVVRRSARPEHLRERILLSRPRWVEAGCAGSIVVQVICATGFAVLAAVAHPILWGVVALSASSIVATSLHLHRYRRALRALEAEIADADGDLRV